MTKYKKIKITGQRGKLDRSRFARCLAIYRRLSQAPLHVERLAQDYEVSVRSIQRDLNAFRAAGYPVKREYAKGWVRMEKYHEET